MRPATLTDRAKRLTWRVGACILMWFVAYAPHLTDVQRGQIREVAVSGLVMAVSVWLASQGRRKPPEGGGAAE